MTHDIPITDSGVRRIHRKAKAWYRWLLPYILPMAPRKKPDDDPKADPSVMLWRAFMTAVLLTVCPWTRPFLGMPAENHDEQEIKNRMAAMEAKVSLMDERVKNLVEGLNFGDRAATRRK